VILDRRSAILAATSALCACFSRRSAPPAGLVFVANQEGRNLAVVDLGALAMIYRIELQAAPTLVLAHARRGAVYALLSEAGAVYEVEAANWKAKRTVRIAERCLSMRLAPDGLTLWVLCSEPPQLVGLKLDQLQAAQRVLLPFKPLDFDFAAGGRLCAVSFGARGAVSLFDPFAGRAGRPIDVSDAVGLVRFRSDARHLLVANTAARMLSILEAPSGRTVVHLPLAVRPDHFCFKPDGGQLFITGEGMDAVVIVYPYSTEVAGTILAGRAPGPMAASQSPDYLFVANPTTGDVTVVDIEVHRTIAAVAVGTEPCFIAVTPDSQYALVLNRRSGNMAVLRIEDIVPTRTRSAPLFTVIPVGSGPVSAAITRV
jgi:YVTN family beta-propeller protein